MTTFLIAEHNQETIHPSTLSTITAATQISENITGVVLGHQCDGAAKSLANVAGIDRVICVDQDNLAHPLAEIFAPVIVELTKDATHIFAPATTFGKNIMPRMAALLDTPQVSDITAVINKNTYHRPIYAGNAIEEVEHLGDVQVVTVRPTSFPAAARKGVAAPIDSASTAVENALSKFVGVSAQLADRPQLATADIVISGGRGLANQENFDRLTVIAERLGAAIGASRAAVDAGFASNDMQVGQTGQIVAPKLYIAVGISGAIQHLAGIKDSGVIVAINKDPDAPIFKVADYGLVADLNDILPEWESIL